MQKTVLQLVVYLLLLVVVKGQSLPNGGQPDAPNGKTVKLARTTGLLPFFEYGPGDDRLGGAKMTYMDTGVLVKVVDSLNADYIISLADNLKAFVAKSSLRFDSSFKSKSYYLSGNWKTYRDDRFDYITISMPEKLP